MPDEEMSLYTSKHEDNAARSHLTYNPVNLGLLKHVHGLMIIESVQGTFDARSSLLVRQTKYSIDVGFLL
jgi:hypothetical protein